MYITGETPTVKSCFKLSEKKQLSPSSYMSRNNILNRDQNT